MSLRNDPTWNTTKSAAERLRWARSKSDYTQERFADAVGMKRGAYRKYESGETALKHEQAVPWARKLKLRWEWLLDGQGLPWASEVKRYSADAETVADLIDSRPEAERPEVVAAIKTLLKAGG